jgi:hypothetical protein
MQGKYTITGFVSAESRERGCDCEQTCDTLKEAKERGRYWLSREYANRCETDAMIQVVEIWRGDELLDELYSRA